MIEDEIVLATLELYQKQVAELSQLWGFLALACLGVVGFVLESKSGSRGSVRAVLGMGFLFFAIGNLGAIQDAQRLQINLASEFSDMAKKRWGVETCPTSPGYFTAHFQALLDEAPDGEFACQLNDLSPNSVRAVSFFHLAIDLGVVGIVLLARMRTASAKSSEIVC